MRKYALLLGGWLVATAITGLVAWGAVSVAGAETSPQPNRPLTPTELAALPSAPTSSTSATIDAPSTSRSETPTTPSSTPGTEATTPTTAGAATSAGTEATTPTTSATAPTTTTTAITTTTAAASGETLTFHVTGGSVGVTVSGETVRLAWTTPNAGFRAETDDDGPEKVVVEFDSAAVESKIVIWVENGQVKHTAEEESHEDD